MGWRFRTHNSESMSHGYGGGVNGLQLRAATAGRSRQTARRGLPAPPPPDPFNNLREQREKKEQSGFEYDPFSINKNLIG